MQFVNNIFTDGHKFYKSINSRIISYNKVRLEGAFSFIIRKKKYYIIGRDHLGCKKIFWGLSDKKKIFFSNNFLKLNSKVKSIKSCPPGIILFIDKKGAIIKKIKISRLDKNNYSFSNLKNYSEEIRNRILFYLTGIKRLYGDKIYICLSGGLDSSIIAYLAKKVFKKVIAVSCTMLDEKNYQFLTKNKISNFDSNIFSDDFRRAYKISKTIGINFRPVFFPESNCKKHLKKVLFSCQDWRDFNVHCAILNYQIAKNLRSYKNYRNEPVLTGDLMNEYVADYTSEIIDGVEYYPQMKLPKNVRQRFFIKGLDSSDRENGVFNFFKIPLFQPYSFVDLYYKKLPRKYLNKNNIKYLLNAKLLNKKILKLISKKKMRAQVGGKKIGILNYFIKKEIFREELEQIFCKSFNLSKNFISNFINVGAYRT